jgi:hypothetical protein
MSILMRQDRSMGGWGDGVVEEREREREREREEEGEKSGRARETDEGS